TREGLSMITTVNGYVCYNCTDIDNAKKGINPAHPNSDDPQSVQAKSKSEIAAAPDKSKQAPAVILSGTFSQQAGIAANSSPSPNATGAGALAAGTKVDVSV